MQERENIALFDRYLAGEMSSDEKAKFEERLTQSESFKKAFDDYTRFAKQVGEAAEYEHITGQLTDIHAELYGKKKQKIFFLKRKVLIPIGAVAAIAILLLTVPFGMDKVNSADSGYQELANNSDDISAEEMEEVYVLEENLNDSMTPLFLDSTVTDDYLEQSLLNDSLELIDRNPKGTAFLIAENGYFLTSKHLVENLSMVKLQHKELGLTFETEVLAMGSFTDLALLRCSKRIAENFDPVPFEFDHSPIELGEEVFTLGYPKRDIVYTEGAVSSETGYESDSLYFEISLPSNAGNSGAPLFNEKGQLIGIVTANNSDKQAVTYILNHEEIMRFIYEAEASYPIDRSQNYTKRTSTKKLIKLYRPFIFELH